MSPHPVALLFQVCATCILISCGLTLLISFLGSHLGRVPEKWRLRAAKTLPSAFVCLCSATVYLGTVYLQKRTDIDKTTAGVSLTLAFLLPVVPRAVLVYRRKRRERAAAE